MEELPISYRSLYADFAFSFTMHRDAYPHVGVVTFQIRPQKLHTSATLSRRLSLKRASGGVSFTRFCLFVTFYFELCSPRWLDQFTTLKKYPPPPTTTTKKTDR